MNVALNKLESIANRIILINSHHLFYPELNCFVKSLLYENTFFPICNKLLTEEFNARKVLMLAEKRVIKEIKSVTKKIRTYLLKHGSMHPQIQSLLDQQLQLLAENKIMTSPLEQVVFMLLHDETADHSLFLKKFGKINVIGDCKNITTHEIFPEHHAWLNQSLYLIQKQQSATWYSLHVVRVFHERYDAEVCDSICNKLDSKKRDSSALRQAHDEVMRYINFPNQQPPNWLLTIEEYKIHILRIATLLKENDLLLVQQPLSTEKSLNNPNLFTYQYLDKNDLRQGAVVSDNIDELFEGASAALLNWMLKIKKPIHPDDLTDSKYNIVVTGGKAAEINQIRNARLTINRKLRKYFQKDAIVSISGCWQIDPSIRKYFVLAQ